MGRSPRHCRKEAFALFIAQLPTLEETDSLVKAAVAVSMHALDGVNPEEVLKTLAGLAGEVNRRVRSRDARALVARLHEVLFEEWGFTGAADDYYNPENSYLSRVLETRRGIPVTLALIYKSVAQQLGLAARGINAPAHFLAAVEADGAWMIVDPYDGGRMLKRDEVFDRLERLSGAPVERTDAALATATHAQWLARIIRNLERVFDAQGRTTDTLAMRELLALVPAAD